VKRSLIKSDLWDPAEGFSDNVKEAWDKAVGAWLNQFRDSIAER
jgi:hypothetical protein